MTSTEDLIERVGREAINVKGQTVHVKRDELLELLARFCEALEEEELAARFRQASEGYHLRH